jgi:hypothetical protein
LSYIDLNTIHNPATGTPAPATWGDQVRDNDEFLIDPPGCSVFHSTTQSTTSGTPFFPACDSETFDNDGMHSTVTNNSRITIQTAGRYLVIATGLWANNINGARDIGFRVNGSTLYSGMVIAPAPSANTVVTSTRVIPFAVNDYIEIRAVQVSGGALNLTVVEFAVLFLTR